MSITEAPAALGVTRTTLSELVNGKRGISPEMAVGPSKVFGGSVASWLTQQAHYDLAHIDADRIKLKRPPSIWTSQLALPYRSETGLVVTLG